jgi:putative peptidoglycan lipid II flippase
MGLNIAVVLPAQHFGFPYPHILIATSTCIGAAVNTTLLWMGLKRAGVFKAREGWGGLLSRVLVANIAMAGLLLWLGADLDRWLALSAWGRVGRLALCVGAAAAAYFAVLFLSGMRLRHVRNVAGA